MIPLFQFSKKADGPPMNRGIGLAMFHFQIRVRSEAGCIPPRKD